MNALIIKSDLTRTRKRFGMSSSGMQSFAGGRFRLFVLAHIFVIIHIIVVAVESGGQLEKKIVAGSIWDDGHCIESTTLAH